MTYQRLSMIRLIYYPCSSCGHKTACTTGEEFLCSECWEMFESAQATYDLSGLGSSYYLSRHPEILDELTSTERSEIARHMRMGT